MKSIKSVPSSPATLADFNFSITKLTVLSGLPAQKCGKHMDAVRRPTIDMTAFVSRISDLLRSATEN